MCCVGERQQRKCQLWCKRRVCGCVFCEVCEVGEVFDEVCEVCDVSGSTSVKSDDENTSVRGSGEGSTTGISSVN